MTKLVAQRWIMLALEISPLALLTLVTNPALILLGEANFPVTITVWLILTASAVTFCLLAAFPIALLGVVVQGPAIILIRSAFIVIFVVSIFYPESGRRLDGIAAEPRGAEYLTIFYAICAASLLVVVVAHVVRRDVMGGLHKLFTVGCIALPIYALATHWPIGQDSGIAAPEFSYATDDNVIFILADMLQGSATEQLFQARPELREEFKDFIVYSRAVSPFPFTSYALPAILSGRVYATDPPSDSVANGAAAAENSFITDAASFGFVQTIVGTPEIPISNSQHNYIRATNSIQLSALLIDLSLTRLSKVTDLATKFGLIIDEAPPQDKFVIELKRESLKTMEAMARAPVANVTKKLLFQHNFITHSPNYFAVENLRNAKLAWRPKPFTVENYFEETEFFFRKLGELISHFKHIGIYDRALIVITGDHGHFIGNNSQLYTTMPGSEDFAGFEAGGWSRAACMYNPAVLIKLPGRTASFELRRSAMSVTQLRPLIAKYVGSYSSEEMSEYLDGLPDKVNQIAVFKPDVDSDPYQSPEDHVLLTVAGNVSDLAQSFVKGLRPTGTYAIGALVSPANALMDDNWAKEGSGAWLRGRTGRMYFEVEGIIKQRLQLRITALPLRTDSHPQQRVQIAVNKTDIGQLTFTKMGTLEIDIPTSAIDSTQSMLIEFTPLDAVSPLSLGLWSTPTPISIFVSAIEILPRE